MFHYIFIHLIDTFLLQKGVDFFYHRLVGRVATEDISDDLSALHLGQQLLVLIVLVSAKHGTTDGEVISKELPNCRAAIDIQLMQSFGKPCAKPVDEGLLLSLQERELHLYELVRSDCGLSSRILWEARALLTNDEIEGRGYPLFL